MAQPYDRRSSRAPLAELELAKTKILAAEGGTYTPRKFDATTESQQPQDDSDEGELVKTE